MLELWRIRNTPSLPALPGPLWLGVMAPNRVLSMGQIELNNVLIIFTNPSARAGYDTRSIFKRSLSGLNSEFFLLLTKAEEISQPYYLPIAGGGIIGFIPFPGVLVLSETQSVFILNWIAWNKTVWHLNCLLILNWTVWKRIMFK